MSAGFKVFENGNVLLASEVMGFMMRQQVCVFADATARDAAITSPSHGQFVYLKDGKVLTFYDNTVWKDL
jgi:hypothetical protein